MRHLIVFATLLAPAWAALGACHSAAKKPTKIFGQSCSSDTECASGRCLPGGAAAQFCTQDCATDKECVAGAAIYCCEQSGDKAQCTVPSDGVCRQAQLGDVCATAGDPICARAGLACSFVDGVRQICTKACASSADCSAVINAQCTTVNGAALCVPPDPTSIRLSDCGGDDDCNGGQICQFFPDNDTNPTGLVTQCSDLKRGAVPAYGACTQATLQCDRDFCEAGFCAATCSNDSYCRPGFICTPLSLMVRADDPSTPANEQITSRLGLCTPQPGSLAPCDAETPGTCPNGESCGYLQHFDNTLEALCQTLPTAPGAMNGVVVGDVCSPLTDAGHDNASAPTRAPVTAGDGVGATSSVRLCATTLQSSFDACYLQSNTAAYCVAPCRSNTDCPSSRPSDGAAISMACVYRPFEPLCLASEFNPTGTADGSSCVASGPISADAMCASHFCADSGVCAPRAVAGTACTRQNQCESLICLNGQCQQLCRTDSECASGALCLATPFLIDVNGTRENASDDRFDLPTVCQAAVSPRVACARDADCTGGTVCATVFNHDGSLSAVCAPHAADGLVLGAACATGASCNSGLCLGASSAAICSAACGDDSDCASGSRCQPATLFGSAVDEVCLIIDAARKADGAPCATFSDCQSNLCANGVCRPLCPKSAHAGDAFGAPADELICVPTPVSVDARFTKRTSDDRVGYVLAPVHSAACEIDGSSTSCVYRPTSATTAQGYLLTPNSDARENGRSCQLAVNCRSGLCAGGVCVAPCSASGGACADATHTCVTTAKALTYERSGSVATVSACVGATR